MALIRHRISSRVILSDPEGRFLLLNTLWSKESGLEPRWVSPGGGVDENEDIRKAASRELFEETGLVVDESNLGEKVAEINFRQEWVTGDYETGVAHFYSHRVNERFDINKSSWTTEEHRDILEVRWWKLEELIESGVAVGPPGLLELLISTASRD